MDSREKNILDGLQKKYSAAKELLRVTQLTELTGGSDQFEKEAEGYIYMIESRENILKEIMDTEQKLTVMGYARLKKTANYTFPMAIRAVENDLDAVIRQIIALDNIHNEKVNIIFSRLKKTLKGIHLTKNINSAYQNELAINGGHFDSRH